MTTLLDHKTTLAYLAHLGYPSEPRTNALQVSKPRKQDRRRNKSSRNVFLCYVCGAAGSGKTSLLRAFAGRKFTDVYGRTEKMFSVVNSVALDGAEKYLVVRYHWLPRFEQENDSYACTVTRVWELVRGGDTQELEKDRPRGCDRLCV